MSPKKRKSKGVKWVKKNNVILMAVIAVVTLLLTFIQIIQSQSDNKDSATLAHNSATLAHNSSTLVAIFESGSKSSLETPGSSVTLETSVTPSSTQSVTIASTQTENIIRYDIPVEGQPNIGAQIAPITIVAFGDFEDPFTQRWSHEVIFRLLDQYHGELRYVFRDFPLDPIHPDARKLAEMAYCFNEQGFYWQFYELAMSAKYPSSNIESVLFNEYSEIDQNIFQDCMNSDRPEKDVMSDQNFGTALGIRSTPTIFINGLAIIGSHPLETFQQIIEMELAGEFPK